MSQDPNPYGPNEPRPQGGPAQDPRQGWDAPPEADRLTPQAPDFAPPAAAPPYGRPSHPQQPFGRPGSAQQPGYPPPTGSSPYGTSPYGTSPYGTTAPQQGYPVPGQGNEPYGTPPQPVAEGAKGDNPLSSLLDLGFTQYATPVVVKVLYILLVLVGAISWIIAIVSGFAWSGASGLGALIGGGIALAAWILLVRVSLEFFLSIIRVAQDAQAIREGVDQLRADRTPASAGQKDPVAQTDPADNEAPGNGSIRT